MARPLNILICNERLLFRFGVDRILLMLARHLKSEGHRATMVCLRHSEAATDAVGAKAVVLDSVAGLGIKEAEIAASAEIDAILAESEQTQPFDLIISGGWPFFSVAGVGLKRKVPTLFIDAGAVPHDGFAGSALDVQLAVRRIRAATLQHFTSVLPISAFIRDSQTLPDRGSARGVELVHLGGDHLQDHLFAAESDDSAREKAVLDVLRGLVRQRAPLLLLLGRFEATGYKNSPAIYDVFDLVRRKHPTSKLLILGSEMDAQVPSAMRVSVMSLGFLSDATLVDVMSMSTAGISPSLWEGFNLPICEIQETGVPAVAFNVGAHPEVIAHPWFLAGNTTEMAAKVCAIIDGRAPKPPAISDQTKGTRFRWSDTVKQYVDVIERLVAQGRADTAAPSRARRVVFVDVSNSSRDPANSGVTRVARQLTSRLQSFDRLEIVLIRWDVEQQRYRLLEPVHRQFIEGHGGPKDLPSYVDPNIANDADMNDLVHYLALGTDAAPLLFLPEIAMDDQIAARVAWGRARSCRIAAVLYDLIPIHHPEYCDPAIVRIFPSYLEAMAKTDLLVSISETTKTQFDSYVAEHNLGTTTHVEAVWLPGQLGTFPRSRSTDRAEKSRKLQILCVSTIEPRKNHMQLINGFLKLVKRRGDLDVSLKLIGNRYGGAPKLAEDIEAICRSEPRIQWLGPVSDTVLEQEIRNSEFLVYSSLVEGFGLPIMESLWMGKPCVCHDQSVMAELAAGGGCKTVDMSDPEAISRVLERLIANPEEVKRLSREANDRAITDWSDYTREVASLIARV